MKNIKCILFDCDGVLVDSEIIGNKVMIAMAQEYGFEMTTEDSIHFFNGKSIYENLQLIETKINRKLPDSFESEYRKQSFEAFKKEIKPIAGVTEFINNLSVDFCVASNGPIDKMELNLSLTGLLDKFENKMFSAFQINSWKPDPELYIHAARVMGYTVNECIIIEDSIAGVKAGISGGFIVYGFANSHTETQLKEAGAILFYSYEELTLLLSE